MKNAITYTAFTQKNGKIEIVQTVSDERIAMDTLLEVRRFLKESLKVSDNERTHKNIAAVNLTIAILENMED